MFGWQSHILGRDRWKSRVKTGKTVVFQGNQGQLFHFFPGRIEAPLLHILDPNYSSFYLKCLRKRQKSIILTFFKQFPKFAPLPLLNFAVGLKFDHIPLCVYYQSYIMQSLVFLTHFFQKLSKKNLWGVGSTPLVQEGLKDKGYVLQSLYFDFEVHKLRTLKVTDFFQIGIHLCHQQ